MPRIAAMLSMLIGLLMIVGFALVQAQDLPGCALTGSSTVMIGGKPALRLSDVVNCPPDTYEIISSVKIDGQPMVHFKSGAVGKVRCFSEPNPSVSVENKQASTTGDVSCTKK